MCRSPNSARRTGHPGATQPSSSATEASSSASGSISTMLRSVMAADPASRRRRRTRIPRRTLAAGSGCGRMGPCSSSGSSSRPPSVSPSSGSCWTTPAWSTWSSCRDAALDPVGDAVSCDVAREAASDIIARLRELGLDDGGTVAIQEVVASPSRAARRAEEAAPGNPDDGVVWDIVTEPAYEQVRPVVDVLRVPHARHDDRVHRRHRGLVHPRGGRDGGRPRVRRGGRRRARVRDARAAAGRPAASGCCCSASSRPSWSPRSSRCSGPHWAGSTATRLPRPDRRPGSSGDRTTGRSSSPCWPGSPARCP